MAKKLFPSMIPGMTKDWGFYKWLESCWQLWRAISQYEVSITPASVAANTTAQQTFTVPGVEVGDQVLAVEPPADISPSSMTCFQVTAVDTVAIYFHNGSAGADTPNSGTYKFAVLKFRGN